MPILPHCNLFNSLLLLYMYFPYCKNQVFPFLSRETFNDGQLIIYVGQILMMNIVLTGYLAYYQTLYDFYVSSNPRCLFPYSGGYSLVIKRISYSALYNEFNFRYILLWFVNEKCLPFLTNNRWSFNMRSSSKITIAITTLVSKYLSHGK